MSLLLTTTPIDTKTNRSPGHGRHAAACQISPSYDAAFRRSLETEKINKQKYEVFTAFRFRVNRRHWTVRWTDGWRDAAL